MFVEFIDVTTRRLALLDFQAIKVLPSKKIIWLMLDQFFNTCTRLSLIMIKLPLKRKRL